MRFLYKRKLLKEYVGLLLINQFAVEVYDKRPAPKKEQDLVVVRVRGGLNGLERRLIRNLKARLCLRSAG